MPSDAPSKTSNGTSFTTRLSTMKQYSKRASLQNHLMPAVINENIETVLRSDDSGYAHSKRKRISDIIVASTILILTSPLLVLFTVVNVFATRGNPLFVQYRANGKDEKFRLFKFRTMRRARLGEVWSHRTVSGDERLTRIGRYLRIFYIDELPQLVNVLMGQMSIVGPRPETVEKTNEISGSHPRFSSRVSVKPGITGAAQIFFRRPESDQDLWRRYYFDRLYIKKCSFWFDANIIVLTVWHIIRRRGT